MCLCVCVCVLLYAQLNLRDSSEKKGFFSFFLNVGKHLLLAVAILSTCPSRPPTAAGFSSCVCVCVHTDRCCRTTQQTPPLISPLWYDDQHTPEHQPHIPSSSFFLLLIFPTACKELLSYPDRSILKITHTHTQERRKKTTI